MTRVRVAAGLVLAGLIVAVDASGRAVDGVPRPVPPVRRAVSRHAPPRIHTSLGKLSAPAMNDVVARFCVDCHNPVTLKGNLSLEDFNVDSAFTAARLPTAEKMIRKLRAQIMPPPGAVKPLGDTLTMLAASMESLIDKASRPTPGARTFPRLNRPEYERAVRDLIGVEVNASDYLPLDTKSANFDNIADAQALSATLLESYLNAAAAVSRMAMGDKSATNLVTTYSTSPFSSQHQWDHLEGTPYGTRGGVVAEHPFPADGMYTIRVNVEGGVGTKLEDIDVSIDGNRVALLKYERNVDRSINSADNILGADYIRTEPIRIKAGQQHVSAAFIRRAEGPYEDLIKPHLWSQAGHGSASSGTTNPPHVLDVAIIGPEKAGGAPDTPSRRIILSCQPRIKAQEAPCAEQIITRLATRAYRRPLTAHDNAGLMGFYTRTAATDGFDEGIRMALQAILASPYFVFRFESPAPAVAPGTMYSISDMDLASRLSFFLWGSIPDDELLAVAKAGRLSNQAVLNKQVKRMLADPRSDALSTRFAAQWLRLQDIEKVRPDAFWFPNYDQQLGDAMQKETELFFGDIVANDRSVLDLFTANYTFVNERLARHYGIPNVSGSAFRRVNYPDSTRRGLLGQGSVLVQTSLANRTSPVLRGKWVMQVLIGMAPPPPPPDVPGLDETSDAKDGKPLTTRQRMEQHRKNPTCNACHQYMDPIGLALDNFDVTGRWRYRENGTELDTRGRMYDGTPLTNPNELSKALLSRPIPLMRTFTENLMAYALGRRIEDYDQPTVRAIAREADAKGDRMSAFITGIINSPAFRSKRADDVVATMDDRSTSK
ncbi:MAG: hypothetical protein JWM95_1268 [Gemmatimonadetes bacterium]|nr:hypothetical protein [Gemmatimonadota bacterium]